MENMRKNLSPIAMSRIVQMRRVTTTLTSDMDSLIVADVWCALLSEMRRN